MCVCVCARVCLSVCESVRVCQDDLALNNLQGLICHKTQPNIFRGCPRGVMVKAMDCGIVVSDFVLQSSYYVHFRANNLWKGMNPLVLPAMG